jgi:hypothetical protein
MNYIRATIFLAFLSFINLILAITFNLVRSTLWEQLIIASNKTGVQSQVVPHLNNLTLVFWLLFIFSAIGAIVWYVLGSHREEHEQYH